MIWSSFKGIDKKKSILNRHVFENTHKNFMALVEKVGEALSYWPQIRWLEFLPQSKGMQLGDRWMVGPAMSGRLVQSVPTLLPEGSWDGLQQAC